MSKEPYVHVITRDGKFIGAISHRIGIPRKETSWQKEVAKFCGEAFAAGDTVTTLYSREEYEAFMDGRPLHRSDKVEKQGELFA